MDQPMSSSAAQEFAQLDLHALAKATVRSFERLAPFSHLQASSSVEATPIVSKIVKKVTTYIQAIDSSILAVQIAHRLGSDAVALCNLAAEQDDQDSSLALISTESERRRRLDRLLRPASDAHEKAQQVKETFREVEQDLYKIAALTKDNTSIIQIPVDPARPKMTQRPLKDVGSDLVANLGVLMEMSIHISHLTEWCEANKADLLAGGLSSTLAEARDETDTFTLLQSVRTRWTTIKDDTWTYHTMIDTLQTRYPDLLPSSTVYWSLVNERHTYQTAKSRKVRTTRKFTAKASNIIRDGALYLACHASLIGP